MAYLRLLILIIAYALPETGWRASAQESASTEGMLQIGTRVASPFAMKSPDGDWEGISIDLLSAIADKLGVRYELQEPALPA